MQIGITYDLKTELPGGARADLPDDLQEEYDSPDTIEGIAAVLRDLGHEAVKLGDGRPLLERLLAQPPEFVFNIAEGQGVSRAREARVPAVLELLGIPYSGSDPLTLAATLDKDCAKRLVASAGVPVPRGVVLNPEDRIESLIQEREGEAPAEPHNAGKPARLEPRPPERQISELGFPLLVKPAWEGSSKGIRGKCLVRSTGELAEAVASLRRDHRQPILVEEFIDGDELTVGLVGNGPPEIIGVMRVLPNRTDTPFIYSLEVKRDYRRQVRYECPARLPAAATAAVERAALTAWQVLGCRDVARVDFRLRDGVPYFLEVNPLPGLNRESSDLVILTQLRGRSYSWLIGRILAAALARVGAEHD